MTDTRDGTAGLEKVIGGMDVRRETIVVPDGREIEFVTAGPVGGMPLVLHEGAPVGLVLFPPTVEAAAQRGLRCVFAARPGYEGSTPRPGRRVADIAADIAAVLDALGAGEFITMGWSGGGPHALACAALLPGRCRAAMTIAGMAPYGSPGLDWLAGMGAENVEGFTIALAGDPKLTELLTTTAERLRAVTGELVVTVLGGVIDEVDKAALTGEFADYIAAGLRSAVRNGIAGWHADELALVSEWGFAPDDPAMPPVAIWHGDQDRMVPYAHGEWLTRKMPGARTHLMPGEGHLSLVATAIGDLLDDLTRMAGL